ncbi:LADA_0E01508g1_1 [Lachancea dasiensis]|uniref:Succinate dehydrogenase assembly factor 4, mitochondrial n=1 Tax=Lachancea dasiensis TaxID=1072105 RepID=A0A1G4JAF4_9SACH|nr:LADA_0E01508g1_1 [Lachancea dasiensis]
MSSVTLHARYLARLGLLRPLTGTRPALVRQFQSKRGPAPPELPKEEQEEFERLQRIAQSQEAINEYNRQVEQDNTKESAKSPFLKADIGGFSPEFSKTIPEFEGDVNPKTGERGGPKQDPLRHGDYSFNGRVTDF